MPVPQQVVEALRTAHHVFVLTGSGASAESGVPTFRDAQQGLWAEFDPLQLATPEAFLRDPSLVWRWYRWRRELVASASPNAGHVALVTLAAHIPALTLVTQNVDGLHQRAGSRNVVEFHGNLFEDRCFTEGCLVSNANHEVDVPRCAACGGLVRPGVVWFGEAIPGSAMAAAEAAAECCNVFLSVGTSSQVWPAAGLAETARRRGAMLVEINIDATPMSGLSHHVIQGKSGAILPELVDCLAL